MHVTEAEVKDLKRRIIAEYASNDIIPGSIISLSCIDEIVWENSETGDRYYGCGKELTRFLYTGDDESTWDIAADMYITHLHNEHGYGVSVNPVDLVD